jgi:poly-gamma-glutamate synthesis protein (capsule biosynthesis protein)
MFGFDDCLEKPLATMARDFHRRYKADPAPFRQFLELHRPSLEGVANLERLRAFEARMKEREHVVTGVVRFFGDTLATGKDAPTVPEEDSPDTFALLGIFTFIEIATEGATLLQSIWRGFAVRKRHPTIRRTARPSAFALLHVRSQPFAALTPPSAPLSMPLNEATSISPLSVLKRALATEFQPSSDGKGVRIALLGNVALGDLDVGDDMLGSLGAFYPWGDTLPHLRTADLVICNFPAAITARMAPRTKGYRFISYRLDPAMAEPALSVLPRGKLALVLANNHIADFGAGGTLDTLLELRRLRVPFAGIGETLEEARMPLELRCESGLRVAVMSIFLESEDDVASNSEARISFYKRDSVLRNPDVIGNIIASFRRLRAVDVFLVSMFCGEGYGFVPLRPTWSLRQLCKRLVERGADVVHGFGQHPWNAMEVHLGKPILYSAGDFVGPFPYCFNRLDNTSFVWDVHVTPSSGKLSHLSLRPARIMGNQVRFLAPEDPLFSDVLVGMAKRCWQYGTPTMLSQDGSTLLVPCGGSLAMSSLAVSPM